MCSREESGRGDRVDQVQSDEVSGSCTEYMRERVPGRCCNSAESLQLHGIRIETCPAVYREPPLLSCWVLFEVRVDISVIY